MKNSILLIISLVLFFSCEQRQRSEQREEKEPRIEAGENPPMTNGEIENMIIRSMVNNRLQIALAQKAKNKTNDIDFQVFCETLINHHKEFQYNLSQLALRYDIEIPGGLTVQAQEELNRIDGLSDVEFRKAFIDNVIETHEEDIKNYERLMAEEHGRIARGMLEKIHDTLKNHLDYAEEINEGMPDSV